MNIFFLDESPKLAAEYQCDKHVVKMILESVQMLCTAHHLTGTGSPDIYKPTHIHHPCTKWVTESRDNWLWLADHTEHLSSEFTKRYGGTHKSTVMLRKLSVPHLPFIPMTTPALAMPDEYKEYDAVEAYRNYYRADKASIAKWERGTDQPFWWNYG